MRIMAERLKLTVLLPLLGAMLLLRARTAPDPREDRERGDVPGWVMITLMSAVLVAALLALAGPALEELFNSAINQVKR